MSKSLLGPRDFIKSNTLLSLHVCEYLGLGGFKLKAPFNNCETSGWDPTLKESISGNNADKAD